LDNAQAVHIGELIVTQSPPFVQHVITKSQKKSEKLRAVVSDARELAALNKRISEEKTKNCYLQRELDMLKQERTRETWLLKNDLKNMEKANSELQQQLKEQQAEYQEQLKAEKKAHQGKLSLPSSTFP
jgi:predicted  nucleic acid-binding Zn-ribbon protein